MALYVGSCCRLQTLTTCQPSHESCGYCYRRWLVQSCLVPVDEGTEPNPEPNQRCMRSTDDRALSRSPVSQSSRLLKGSSCSRRPLEWGRPLQRGPLPANEPCQIHRLQLLQRERLHCLGLWPPSSWSWHWPQHCAVLPFRLFCKNFHTLLTCCGTELHCLRASARSSASCLRQFAISARCVRYGES